jgi:hypothetical protein
MLCTAAFLLLVLVVGCQATLSIAYEDDNGSANSTSRSLLLQRTWECSKVHRACVSCRNQRVKGTKKTENVCTACSTGWRLRKDGVSKTCGEYICLQWHYWLQLLSMVLTMPALEGGGVLTLIAMAG